MSKEGLNALAALIENDQAANEAIAQGGPQVVLEIAREHNLDITLEDLKQVLKCRKVDENQAASELSDEDLDGVAGGNYSSQWYWNGFRWVRTFR